MACAYLVERFSIAEDEIDRADDEGVFEVVASSSIVKSVLLPVECAPVKCIEIARGSQRNCLMLLFAIRRRPRVLQLNPKFQKLNKVRKL